MYSVLQSNLQLKKNLVQERLQKCSDPARAEAGTCHLSCTQQKERAKVSEKWTSQVFACDKYLCKVDFTEVEPSTALNAWEKQQLGSVPHLSQK